MTTVKLHNMGKVHRAPLNSLSRIDPWQLMQGLGHFYCACVCVCVHTTKQCIYDNRQKRFV